MSAQTELLESLEAFANANNRSGYWQTLADAGFDYGRLALGVVDNLTLTLIARVFPCSVEIFP